MTPPGDSTMLFVAGQGLVPMTPEMWLALSPSHIRHAQLAAVRQFPQGMHDAALLLHRSHVLPCRFGAACLPVAWCHGWVGWGANIFCRFSFQGGCIAARCAQGCLTVVA